MHPLRNSLQLQTASAWLGRSKPQVSRNYLFLLDLMTLLAILVSALSHSLPLSPFLPLRLSLSLCPSVLLASQVSVIPYGREQARAAALGASQRPVVLRVGNSGLRRSSRFIPCQPFAATCSVSAPSPGRTLQVRLTSPDLPQVGCRLFVGVSGAKPACQCWLSKGEQSLMTLIHALKLSSQALYLDPEGSAPAMFVEFIWCSDLLRCMPLLALAASDSLSDAPI